MFVWVWSCWPPPRAQLAGHTEPAMAACKDDCSFVISILTQREYCEGVPRISRDYQNTIEILLSHFFWKYHTIFNHEILVYFSLSMDLSKLNDFIYISYGLTYSSMNWCIFCVNFMHQRMILFVLYGLFHKFHANVAFPAIYAFVTKSEISQVSCDNRIKT